MTRLLTVAYLAAVVGAHTAHQHGHSTWQCGSAGCQVHWHAHGHDGHPHEHGHPHDGHHHHAAEQSKSPGTTEQAPSPCEDACAACRYLSLAPLLAQVPLAIESQPAPDEPCDALPAQPRRLRTLNFQARAPPQQFVLFGNCC